MGITHAKVSAISDGADTTLVRPSDWNAGHVGNGLGMFVVTDDEYGAVGDGLTDDQPAIQAAIDAAGAAGGGTVYFPRGRYFLDSTAGSPAYLHGHLDNPYDDVSFVGETGSVLIADDSYPIIFQGTPDFWQDLTVRTMGAISRGATSLTLSTHNQAANFAVGDYILIRTGQTIDATPASSPDSEVNQVVTSNSSTGVITLAYPTLKAYAQEYFITGTAGLSSTNVTANLAPLGISNLMTHIVDGQSYIGLGFEHTGTGDQSFAFLGGNAINTHIERCNGIVAHGFDTRGTHRFTTVRDCRVHFTGTDADIALSADKACSDILWDGNFFTGESAPFLHIHEGATGITVRDNVWRAKGRADAIALIDIRARARDVHVIGNTIDSYSDGGLVNIEATCVGGIVADNEFLGAQDYAIVYTGTGYRFSNNRNPNGAEIQLGTAGTKVAADSEVRAMYAWVKYTDASVVLGTLPKNATVIGVDLYVTDAFNPAGTGTISVGSPEGGATWWAAATNVKSKAHTQITAAAVDWPYLNDSAAHTLTAYYAYTSTAASTGYCLVIVQYIPRGPKPT